MILGVVAYSLVFVVNFPSVTASHDPNPTVQLNLLTLIALHLAIITGLFPFVTSLDSTGSVPVY